MKMRVLLQKSQKIFFTLLCVCLLAIMGCEQNDQRGVAFNKKQPGPPLAPYKESHALVIGVTDYSAGWPRLPGVREDINAVTQVLKDKGFHVVVIENPTKDEMERAYDDFIVKYGLQPENRLLLYFAGHGYTHKPSYATDDPREWMGYIVAHDAPLPGTDMGPFFLRAVSMQRFADIARRIEAKHVLFVFDSCFSGSIFALSRAKPAREDIARLMAKPVRQFISSGTADQEVSDAGGFRRQFIAALDGAADRNDDGYVTGSELGLYLQETVPDYEAQTPQYGKIRDPLLDKGDFVFALQAAAFSPPTSPVPAPNVSRIEKAMETEKIVALLAPKQPNVQSPLPSPDVLPPPPLRLQGHLQINVNVDAAQVRVDEKDTGVARREQPLQVRDLTAGKVRVQVKADGYEPQERVVDIPMDKWVQEAFVLNRLPVPEKSLPPAAQSPAASQPPPQPAQESDRSTAEVEAPPPLAPQPSAEEQSDDIVTYWTLDPSGRPVPASKPGKGSQQKAKGN